MQGRISLKIAMAARIVLWALIAVIVLFGREIVSADLFPCVWKTYFGFLCSACGASRAVVSLLSGDFGTAVGYNPVITLGLFPLFSFFMLSDLLVLLLNFFTKKRRLSPFEYCFAVFELKPAAAANTSREAGGADE